MKLEQLEKLILSCLLQKPELFEKLELTENNFNTQKRTFIFLRNFYKNYKTLDLRLMSALIKDNFRIITNVVPLLDLGLANNFEFYQKAYKQELAKSGEYETKVNLAYLFTTQLINNEITIEDFKMKVGEI